MLHLMNDYDGPIYSPSQTEVFLHCPMKWYLRYQYKYIPKSYSEKEIAGCIGTAFSIWREFSHESDAEERALASLTDGIRHLEDTRECVPRAMAYQASAPDRLRRFIALFEREAPVPRSWELYDHEKAFPRWGNSRIDVAYTTSGGIKGILDYKTRGRLNANSVEKVKREFATRGQMWQYCCMASQEAGELINQFSICLLAMEPRPQAYLWQYRVKPSTLEVWLAGRMQVWKMMKSMLAEEMTPWMAEEHADKFGRCQYEDVCMKHGFDQELILQDFQVR